MTGVSATHPSQTRLLDRHAGALDHRACRDVDEHVEACSTCRDAVDALVWLDRQLTEWPAPAPPQDGLTRVMARIDGRHPAPLQLVWLAPTAATLGAVLVGSLVLALVGPELASHTALASLPQSGALRTVAGLSLAATVLFGIGSLITLALAPALLLEARRRDTEASPR